MRTALLVPHGVLPEQHVLGLWVLRHKDHAVKPLQVDALHLHHHQQQQQAHST
jgi:hypothetical protein